MQLSQTSCIVEGSPLNLLKTRSAEYSPVSFFRRNNNLVVDGGNNRFFDPQMFQLCKYSAVGMLLSTYSFNLDTILVVRLFIWLLLLLLS